MSLEPARIRARDAGPRLRPWRWWVAFALVMVALVTPSALLLRSAVSEVDARVKFARDEVEGLAFLSAVQGLAQHASEHALAGSGPGAADRRERLAALADAEAARLRAAETRVDRTLETGGRGAALAAEWDAARRRQQPLVPADLLGFIADATELTGDVAEASHLLTDPEPAPYAAAAALVTLTRVQQLLLTLAMPPETGGDRTRAGIARNVGRAEALLAVVERDLRLANLGSGADGRLVETLLADVQAEPRPRLGGDAPYLRTFPLWRSAATSLERHLRARIAEDQRRRQVLLGTGAVGALLLGAAGVYTARMERRRGLAEHELNFRAFHDGLTGIGNRYLFNTRLAEALRGGRDTPYAALILLDLDDFKAVNDTLGHAAGDVLLVTVAERLSGVVRERDTLARLGGDEFALVLPGLDEAAARRIAQRVAQALTAPVHIAGRDFAARGSIGVCIGQAGEDPEQVLQRADVAMYEAKHIGDGSPVVYSSIRHQRILNRLGTEGMLRAAVEQDQLRVHYQAIVDLQTQAITGAEALVRWLHPDRGLLEAAQFLPLAEETGTIVEIGTWVLREALTDAVAWNTPGHARVEVAVNLSARQLRSPSLVDDVHLAAQHAGLDLSCVVLEVTEAALTEAQEVGVGALRTLQALGARIALDDFGTGASTLAQLRRLPVDVLKIDRPLVEGVARHDDDWAVATAVVKLAVSLGKRTLAEGVEQPVQAASLRALGCDQAQGVLFAPPLPAEEFAALLRTAREQREPAAPAYE